MDPNAKHLRAMKRQIRGIDLIKQGCQLNGWSAVKLDENVFVIGKPQMAVYVKEIIDEQLRQETAKPSQASSLELGASSSNDREAPHVSEPLPEVKDGSPTHNPESQE